MTCVIFVPQNKDSRTQNHENIQLESSSGREFHKDTDKDEQQDEDYSLLSYFQNLSFLATIDNKTISKQV